jgi:hypothetical protein
VWRFISLIVNATILPISVTPSMSFWEPKTSFFYTFILSHLFSEGAEHATGGAGTCVSQNTRPALDCFKPSSWELLSSIEPRLFRLLHFVFRFLL